ncbi:MAG: S8 family peptidase [Elusimicrobia bacterium]|nr:S8 family peptidase [Elusimicrobiota bacterium]
MSIRSFLAALAVVLPLAVQAQQPAPAGPVHKIVVFKRSVTPASRIRVVEQTGATVKHDLRLISAIAVAYPPKVFQTAELGLRANRDVVRIEDDYVQNWIQATPFSLEDVRLPALRDFLRPHGIRPLQDPSDPEQPWGISRVKAEAAWKATRGAGVKVAVIDTGIDFKHADLAANVKGGWSAVDKENPANFMDDNGHGTHVSGTIAAVRNSTGVVGVAPEASLYGVKVLDGNGSGTFADVIAGIQWAAENEMQVANMSLGASRGTEALADAVKAAAKAGVTIIAAAGNSGGSVGFPAAYPECIAVAASDVRDELAYFSSRGPEVAFIAPGVDVKSTYMGGDYDTLSGTSMATPHVAGLATLATAAKNVRGEAAMRQALKAAATPLPGLSVEEQGAGMIDATKLVE